MYRLKHGLWLVTLGVLHGYSIALPAFGTYLDGQALWWLQLPSLAALVHAMAHPAFAAHRPARVAAVQGFLFAHGWLASSMWWLFVSMHTYGGLHAALAALAVVVLTGLLALFYAGAAGLFVALHSPALRHKPWARAGLFAACWMGAELLRASVLTGLPWAATGYAHLEGPLSALAPVGGVYVIGFVAALMAAWFVFTPVRWGKGLLVAVLLAASVAPRWIFIQSQETAHQGHHAPVPVTVLQGNIAQDEKFNARTGVHEALGWYRQQIQQAKTPVVIAPETALPLTPAQMPRDYLPSLYPGESTPYKNVLVGIVLTRRGGGLTNSLLGVSWRDAGLKMYRYDKHHLVAFGEFIPPLFRWFTDLMHIALGDLTPGSLAQPSMSIEVQGFNERLAPLICFEDLFGEELARRFALPATAPTVLISIANLGWFGNSVALSQHLNISRMRALEFDRPVVRATNTGISAVVDATGQVTHRLPALRRGVLQAVVQPRESMTPYARWSARWGLRPLVALSLAVVLLALFVRRYGQSQ